MSSSPTTLSQLPTPSLIIDLPIFKSNCTRMISIATEQGMDFRAHIKSHKTREGTLLQLGYGLTDNEDEETSTIQGKGRLVVSTVEELLGLLKSGTIEKSRPLDVLFSLPPNPTTLARLIPIKAALSLLNIILRIMIDSPSQVKAIDSYSYPTGSNSAEKGIFSTWSAFVKCDAGDHRAGLTPDSKEFGELIETLAKSERVEIFGFYTHAGGSYASNSKPTAASHLLRELSTVNSASLLAHDILSSTPNKNPKRDYSNTTFTLSIGATPTANSMGTSEGQSNLQPLRKTPQGQKLGFIDGGKLELHAGVYPLNDLQQLATSLITIDQVACSVLATVCSVYPTRGQEIDGKIGGEGVCDAGGLAMSKDTGPEAGYGRVVYPKELENCGWRIGRLSQEHGILVPTSKENSTTGSRLPIYGEKLKIIPQHACLTLAAYEKYYVVDSSQEDKDTKWEDWKIRDVWVPWKFW